MSVDEAVEYLRSFGDAGFPIKTRDTLRGIGSILQSQAAEIERLTRERDAAVRSEAQAVGNEDALILRAEAADRVIAGLNEQLTEQFELSTKYISLAESAQSALSDALDHVEQLSELLEIIKEHWIDYDHVFLIATHESRAFLSKHGRDGKHGHPAQ